MIHSSLVTQELETGYHGLPPISPKWPSDYIYHMKTFPKSTKCLSQSTDNVYTGISNSLQLVEVNKYIFLGKIDDSCNHVVTSRKCETLPSWVGCGFLTSSALGLVTGLTCPISLPTGLTSLDSSGPLFFVAS